MKVLVTGPDGLLGSNIVRALLEAGHAVRAAIQPGSASPALAGLELERRPCELPGTPGALGGLVEGCDAVIHAAAVTDHWAPAELTWRVNLEGTRGLVEAAIGQGLSRFVFIGSASSFQFGSRERPGDESAPFSPAYRGVAYMESKRAAMELVHEAARTRGLPALTVAPTFMFGPHDARPSSGELMVRFLGGGLRYVSRGGRNFAHARDVAAGAVAALDRGAPGEAYIAGGVNLTYVEFFQRAAEVARARGHEGARPPRGALPDALVHAAGAVGGLLGALSRGRRSFNRRIARLALMGTYYSSAKAIRELGLPQTPLERAIADELAGLSEYGHLPAPAPPSRG